jgi:hypothetical protein
VALLVAVLLVAVLLVGALLVAALLVGALLEFPIKIINYFILLDHVII